MFLGPDTQTSSVDIMSEAVYKLLMIFFLLAVVLDRLRDRPTSLLFAWQRALQTDCNFILLQFVHQAQLWQHNPELIRHVQFFVLALMQSALPNPATCQPGPAMGSPVEMPGMCCCCSGSPGWEERGGTMVVGADLTPASLPVIHCKQPEP